MADIVFKVMLSSTFRDMREEREAVRDAILGQGMLPLIMETDPAMPDRGIITNSLAKVDESNAYVVLISNYRYGQVIDDPIANPDELSITELEFRHAEKRGLPLCIFLMDEDVPISPREIRKEATWAEKLQAFRDYAQNYKRIISTFKSTEELKTKVTHTLGRLRDVLISADPMKSTSKLAGSTGQNALPHPPAFHAQPPYTPGHLFEGRTKELALLNTWASSPEPVLLFEGIGGMGKSMVTWEWIAHHATLTRTDWAGRLWYSFYERGADMRDFKITALAYMTRQSAEVLQARREEVLTNDLLTALRQRPWLLTLDGLERVLAAYHRSDAAQVHDSEVNDDTGLHDRKPTDCIRRGDEDLLRALTAAGPSKVLISSRLMPRALLNISGQPLRGVKHEALLGLAPEDAEAMLRRAGISGHGPRIRRYLTASFAGHPLVVGFVSGLIRKSLWAGMDFDRWVDDPRGGAAVDLTSAELTIRQNNILKHAFEALKPEAWALMVRMAILSNAAGLDVLEALNPVRPAPPEEVKEPIPPDQVADPRGDRLRELLREAKTIKKRGAFERFISDRERVRRTEYEFARKAYENYQSSITAWRQSSALRLREAQAWLNNTLIDLEERGLLLADRYTSSFDLHPVVRGYAIRLLDPEARGEAGQRVADFFSARSAPDYDKVTTLKDIVDRVQVVQALNLAGKRSQAWDALNGDMRAALYRLERHHETLALLRPLFVHGWSAPPSGVTDPGFVAGAAALALDGIGRQAETEAQDVFAICESSTKGLNGTLSIRILNHSLALRSRNALEQADRALALARGVAAAIHDQPQMLWCDLHVADVFLEQGNLAEARQLWSDLKSRPAWQHRDTPLEAQCLLTEARLLRHENALTEAHLLTAVNDLKALGYRALERWVWRLLGAWYQDARQDAQAVAAFDYALQMARDAGLEDLESEARRGLSLARRGDRSRAMHAAASAERAPPHAALAALYVELGDHAAALRHSTAGAKWAIADGPPHYWHWQLDACVAVLRELGEPEPILLPFDPVNSQLLPYEADIKRLLEQHRRKKPS